MDGEVDLFLAVLLGTSRVGRRSADVARLVLTELGRRAGVRVELLDLADYDFPVMRHRLDQADQPPLGLREFSGKLARADGLVIVTPEYKNGYPGALKNALDYLDRGIFDRKPLGIATVSSGWGGGLNCLAQLRLVCLAMGGVPIPASFPVARVQEAFDEQGEVRDPGVRRRLGPFLDELIWYTRAIVHQRRADARRPEAHALS
jgi:NAD(P)H-dependent FMN reductase